MGVSAAIEITEAERCKEQSVSLTSIHDVQVVLAARLSSRGRRDLEHLSWKGFDEAKEG